LVTGLKKNGLKMKNKNKIKRFFCVELDITPVKTKGYARGIVADMNLRASYN
jgi:hypothetical protein